MTTKLTNFEHIMMSEQQAENLSITGEKSGEKTFWRKKWRKICHVKMLIFLPNIQEKRFYRSWAAEKLNRILTIFSELNLVILGK
jgi:hypothetical protein